MSPGSKKKGRLRRPPGHSSLDPLPRLLSDFVPLARGTLPRASSPRDWQEQTSEKRIGQIMRAIRMRRDYSRPFFSTALGTSTGPNNVNVMLSVALI